MNISTDIIANTDIGQDPARPGLILRFCFDFARQI
jgi:hypothetical protein